MSSAGNRSGRQHAGRPVAAVDDSAMPASEDQIENANSSDILPEKSTLSSGMRRLLVVLGGLFVCLGIIGIILPLVPTTPFLLLAAACYARSSEKRYNWLLNHRWFGEYLRNYQAGKGIPLKVKMTMLVFLWTSIGLSAAFVIDIPWVRVMLLVIASAVSVHMYYLPTFRPENESR